MENSGGKGPPGRASTRAEAPLDAETSSSWVRFKSWSGGLRAHLVLAEVDKSSMTARSASDVRTLRLAALAVAVVGLAVCGVLFAAFGVLVGLVALVFGLPALVIAVILMTDRLQRLRKRDLSSG